MAKTFGPKSRARIATAVRRVEQMGRDLLGGKTDFPFGGVTIGMFIVKEVLADHLRCRSWDGEEEGTVDVLVAKPWLLRRTPFDTLEIAGIEYTYINDYSRTAEDTETEETEEQEITPTYQPAEGEYAGDVIFAAHTILRGTAVVIEEEVEEETVTTIPYWIDLNIDGRAWAKVPE